MNELLPYIIKSTLCLSLLYLAFRTVMRKETFFAINRMVLLTIVILSFIIPLLYLPAIVQPAIQEQIIPDIQYSENQIPLVEVAESSISTAPSDTGSEAKPQPYSTGQIFLIIYLAGMLVSLLYFLHGIISVLLMLRKAQVIKKQGYRLFILEKDLPAFSFGKMVFISQTDYREHGTTILAHEQQHVRLGHFYDLLLMETAKMIHWFNPVIYLLIQDLKAIHEYQADQQTLIKGIDATSYQLLIIEKGVGQQRLALANSFNHCQIKKRITMMNKQKTGKARRWKVATFLPLLALLLMAFGRTGESVPLKVIAPPEITQEQQSPQSDLSIEIRNDGNYISNKLYSKEELINWAKTRQKTNEEVLLVVDNQISSGRVDEVREALENAEIYHVNQKSPDSDEIIYPHGDVTESAKFTQGKWDAWMNSQLKNLSEGKSDTWEYKIKMGFIIDKSGKVRGAHIIKGSDNAEINAAFEKLLAQIPDWKPARKGSKEVSVYYRGIKTASIK